MLSAGFERGAPGATLTTADRGDHDKYDAVPALPAGSSFVYDTAHAVIGTQALKVQTGATSGSCRAQWTTKWLAQGARTSDHYGRLYLYLTANPPTTLAFCSFFNAALANVSILRLSATGKLQLVRAGGNLVGTSTASIALNAWARVDWHFTHSATTGTVEAKLFNSAGSSTPTETLAGGPFDTGTADGGVQFGLTGAAASVGPYWIDGIVAAAASYPAPGPLPTSRGILLPQAA